MHHSRDYVAFSSPGRPPRIGLAIYSAFDVAYRAPWRENVTRSFPGDAVNWLRAAISSMNRAAAWLAAFGMIASSIGCVLTQDIPDPALDIPSGANPYNLALTPDGALGFVVNNGVRGNNASITVFDARGPHPRVIDTLAIGDGPEGFAMAPDGKSAVVLLLHGSNASLFTWEPWSKILSDSFHVVSVDLPGGADR